MRDFLRPIIPDSHGNHIDLPARDAFLRDLRTFDPPEIVMLGDPISGGDLDLFEVY